MVSFVLGLFALGFIALIIRGCFFMLVGIIAGLVLGLNLFPDQLPVILAILIPMGFVGYQMDRHRERRRGEAAFEAQAQYNAALNRRVEQIQHSPMRHRQEPHF